ncbi:MAG: 7-cyano-7-deazaguanine synthase QueC [Rhodospirillaceae bacterium]|nr:7-cyano-7-deazaguanine synthase QueC [Rhodospirillaceae bacterium]|tara:strand:- start:37 stop:753 length:717 start_codon:yes stop_codon:yes gene_type:complete
MNKQIKSNSAALVLFSGGQDSTTCLAWALENYDQVETIGFNYGQRHDIEMQCRPKILKFMREHATNWSEKLGKDHILELNYLSQITSSALTKKISIKTEQSGLPNTFVPGRNLAFLTAAGSLACQKGFGTLVGGMCETDYSGYPDCRQSTISAQEKVLSLGMDIPIKIEVPLMNTDKAGIWALAYALGGDKLIQAVIKHTHTCYVGDRQKLQDWGYGCAQCPACLLRSEGYKKFVEVQ